MTKGFWEHLDEWHGNSAQMEQTLTLESAVAALTDPVHPGALKYCKEIGPLIDNARPTGSYAGGPFCWPPVMQKEAALP